jgi:hypothetical protein
VIVTSVDPQGRNFIGKANQGDLWYAIGTPRGRDEKLTEF